MRSFPGRWLRARVRRFRTARELMGLGRREFDRTLTDVGLTRSALPEVLRSYPESGELLGCMMEHVGVDLAWLRANPRMMRDLDRSCGLCAERRRCRKWMKRRQPADGYRAFCPNAFNFDVIPRIGVRRAPRTGEAQ